MYTRAYAIHVCVRIFLLTAFAGKKRDKCRMFEEAHAKQGSATDTATDHAIRSTATEHASPHLVSKTLAYRICSERLALTLHHKYKGCCKKWALWGTTPEDTRSQWTKRKRLPTAWPRNLPKPKSSSPPPFKNIWTQCRPLALKLQPPALLQSMRNTRRL